MADDDTGTDTGVSDQGDQGDDGGGSSELDAIRADPEAALRTIEALKAEAAENRRKLRKAEVELERTRNASLGDQERAVAEAEQRGRAAAEAEHGRKLLEAQVLAAAAGKLRDPADAVRYLDLDDLLELDDGQRDLGKRVDELLQAKAYLGVSNGDDTARAGVRSQGPRTEPGGTRASDADGSAWLRRAARGH